MRSSRVAKPSSGSTRRSPIVVRLAVAMIVACAMSSSLAVSARAGTATGSSNPRHLTAVGDLLYFTANDGSHGRELWASDGTRAGTHLVKDIDPAGGSDPYQLTAMGGKLYFTAEVGGIRRLWESDGTGLGTEPVIQLPGDPYVEIMQAVGGTLYFLVGSSDRDLWKTDGTEGGTVVVRRLPPGSYYDPVAVADTLYFWRATDGSGSSRGDGYLWKSDGTADGTVRVKTFPDQSFNDLTAVGTRLFLLKQVGDTGHFPMPAALWKSNGTADGTKLVRDLAPGAWDSVYGVYDAGGTAYFQDFNGLWKSDGTYGGTVHLKDVAVSYSHDKTYVGGQVYFVSLFVTGGDLHSDLWASNGTTAGTRFVSHAAPWRCLANVLEGEECTIGRHAGGQTGFAGRLYFPAENGGRGVELWRSDGTTAGTERVKDIRAGTKGSDPSNFTEAAGQLFFVASDGVHGRELWVSDGTGSGTTMVRDIDDE